MKEKNTFNSIERFTNRVENYIKYQPHYPKEIIPYLHTEYGFDKNKIVADIGSGPGISCENFIDNGNTVYAVEPNDEMRKAAEVIFSESKNFISIKGTAESTTLKNNSIDFIIAGQAFHWFDRERCKIEFKRILKNEGHIVLMWNEKTSSNDFMRSYYELLERFGTDYEKINHANMVDDNVIADFFSPEPFNKKHIDHTHLLDYAGLEGRLFSSSYIPLEGERFKEMIEELKDIFGKYNEKGKVEMEYVTNLYIC